VILENDSVGMFRGSVGNLKGTKVIYSGNYDANATGIINEAHVNVNVNKRVIKQICDNQAKVQSKLD
jgi:hypothetical protein